MESKSNHDRQNHLNDAARYLMVKAYYMSNSAWTGTTVATTWTVSYPDMFLVGVETAKGPENSKATALLDKKTLAANRKKEKAKKAMASKAENRRRKKAENFVGKIVHVEGVGCSQFDGEWLCTVQSERSIFCLSLHTAMTSEHKIVLDRTEDSHYIVTSVRQCEATIRRLIEVYNAQEDEGLISRFMLMQETICRVCGIAKPVARPDVTMVVDGEVVLSRKMQALIRTHFCADYQRKVTPLMKQLAQEMFVCFRQAIVSVEEKKMELLPQDRKLYLPS